VPIVLKSGSFKLLEPSGPVQAYNGIALPFTFTYDVRLLKEAPDPGPGTKDRVKDNCIAQYTVFCSKCYSQQITAL